MEDPVSWLMIRPGWRVLDAQGDDVGRVAEVTGDSNRDIFDGLAVTAGAFAAAKYVPAEQVAEITDGAVHLSVSRDHIGREQTFEEPPEAIEIEPEAASPFRRLLARLAGRR
jgi:hypothetical protein